jgi:hypothetical protein
MRGAREENPMRRWTLTMSDGCYDAAVLADFDALRERGGAAGGAAVHPGTRRLPSLADVLGADADENTPAPAHED